MKNIAKLSIKVLSIYFLVDFISTSIPVIFGLLGHIRRGTFWGTFAIIAGYLIKIIIPLYLWYSADKLSNIIIKSKEDKSLENIDYKKIQIIAFSVVGIVLLAINIPNFIKSILGIISMPGKIRLSMPMLQNIIVQIIELTIGGWLLFGSQKLVKYLKK
jgi:mannose/fructose/N-acetylgalactosamine-specific phosphotransferase system component IIC